MRYKKKVKIYAILFVGITNGIYSQKNIVASGSDANGVGGHVNYTIGQLDYYSINAVGGSVSGGVQQAYEIYITTGLNEKTVSLDMVAFPNPMLNYLTLKISQDKIDNLSYSVFNANGELIVEDRITQESTTIPTSDFTAGIYIVKITDKNQIIKTYKIIKN